MGRPCVRVERTAGETTRRALEEADLRDHRYRIESDEDAVYIPVRDASAVDGAYAVVEREVAERDDQVLPEDLLDFRPTYERLGRLVLLQEDDPERAEAAAAAFMAADLPVDAVLNQASAVRGTERVAEWTRLAGSTTETQYREYGAEFRVDPTQAYFSARLATERQRVITQIEENERVFDMFAGIGPFAIRAAMAGATVVAVDINPAAVALCRENARRNGVEDRVTVIEGDVRSVAKEYADWADRVIMNLPHSAAEYLPVARRLVAQRARLHYYDIQSTDDPFGPGESAIRAAFRDDTVDVVTRRVVRSYAPDQVNVCLDVDVWRSPEDSSNRTA